MHFSNLLEIELNSLFLVRSHALRCEVNSVIWIINSNSTLGCFPFFPNTKRVAKRNRFKEGKVKFVKREGFRLLVVLSFRPHFSEYYYHFGENSISSVSACARYKTFALSVTRRVLLSVMKLYSSFMPLSLYGAARRRRKVAGKVEQASICWSHGSYLLPCHSGLGCRLTRKAFSRVECKNSKATNEEEKALFKI